MALVTLPQTFSYPEGLELTGLLSINGGTLVDAAGEYFGWAFQAKEAMTISHIGFGIQAVVGSGAADLRVETVGADGLPSGSLWATNTNVSTGAFSVGWNGPYALTASASVSAGDLVAIIVVYASGTSYTGRNFNAITHMSSPLVWRLNNTGTPAVASPLGAPLAVGNSSTTFYNLGWTFPHSSTEDTNFNNASATFRRGIRFRLPFACRIAGGTFVTALAGDFDFDLYSDAGTLLASASVDGDHFVSSQGGIMFDTPYEASANTWYRMTVEATTVTNQEVSVLVMPSADYASGCPWGANGHETNWNGASWTDTATEKMPVMQVLIDQIDDGTGSGGGSRAYGIQPIPYGV